MGLMRKLFHSGSGKKRQYQVTGMTIIHYDRNGRPIKTEEVKASNHKSNEPVPTLEQIRRDSAQQRAEFQRKNARLQSARAALSESGDLEAAIAEYEAAIEDFGDQNMDSHRMHLASCYIKAGQFDKAWGYLNMLMVKYPHLTPKVHKEQVRILKKEKRWSEAMRCLLEYYIDRCIFGIPGFNKKAFLKDLSPIANKLGLDEDEREYFAYLLDRQIQSGYYLFDPIDQAFKRFGASKGWF